MMSFKYRAKRICDILGSEQFIRDAVAFVATLIPEIMYADRERRPVFAFGCGGSAAQAEHFTGELMGMHKLERPVLAVALSSMIAAQTAMANDRGFERWPAILFEGRNSGRSPVVIFSTSCMDHTGNGSPVVNLARACIERGIFPFIVTGQRFNRSPLADEPGVNDLVIPSDDVETVQEITLLVIHEIITVLATRIT